MKASPGRQAETITALRDAFGPGDFRARDIVKRPELVPLVHKLVGRRGDFRKRMGRWLREHHGSQSGEFTLRGEFISHKRIWVWAVEHPSDSPSAEEILRTVEREAQQIAVKLAPKPGSGLHGELAALRKQRRFIEQQEARAKLEAEEVQRREDRDEWREHQREQKKETARHERANAPQWAVQVKAPRETIGACIDALREPYTTLRLVEGRWLLPCSRERASEIAQRMNAVIQTHKLRGLARPVVIGETQEQATARREEAKRARTIAARARLEKRFVGDPEPAGTIQQPIKLKPWRFEF